jgi:UDP-N-acetylglucosamine--N-acetylmuramyl-(pentapeptide) pyrophosphoryl-undecaprenol N-acetylglucosamine transferase
MTDAAEKISVAIACGGTGGHLFPGLAVAEQLRERACDVALLVSPKDVDQQAVKAAPGLRVVTLPAVAFQTGSRLDFFRGSVKSYRAAKKLFHERRPHAALGMGGFTSAPPLLAARRCGAATFLHESNAVPGRANRWLAWVVDRAFVGFPSAAAQLHGRNTVVTGTPVRPQFEPGFAAPNRLVLGLHPDRPLLLVVGGSQGASGLNDAVIAALPRFAELEPETQWMHLTGPRDVEKVKAAYAAARLPAVVLPCFEAMDMALAAASVVISRAGASVLAEIAAMRVPAVLVPFPAAAGNHQWHNAHCFEETGAARLLEQSLATPEALTRVVRELLNDATAGDRIRSALIRWQAPRAASDIAEMILHSVTEARKRGLGASGDAGVSAFVRRSSVIA